MGCEKNKVPSTYVTKFDELTNSDSNAKQCLRMEGEGLIVPKES